MKVKDFIDKLTYTIPEIILCHEDQGTVPFDSNLKIDVGGQFIKVFYNWDIEEIDITTTNNNKKTFKLIISEGIKNGAL